MCFVKPFRPGAQMFSSACPEVLRNPTEGLIDEALFPGAGILAGAVQDEHYLIKNPKRQDRYIIKRSGLRAICHSHNLEHIAFSDGDIAERDSCG